jgi:hypothetical protein
VRGLSARARGKIVALCCAALIAGCVTPPLSVVWTDRVPTAAPEAVTNQPVVARDSASITLQPISPRGAVVGVPYRYDMPHCGIKSPIDVDGSFWDADGIEPDSVEFDGTSGSFRLTTPTTATFTRSDGALLELFRHDGAKRFSYCD